MTKLPTFSKMLGVSEEDGIVIYSIIRALVISARVTLLVKQNEKYIKMNVDKIPSDIKLKNEAKSKALLVEWKEAMTVLYKSGILDINERGAQKKMPKVSLWGRSIGLFGSKVYGRKLNPEKEDD